MRTSSAFFSPAHRSRGIALIITVVLLAFLLIVVLGLVSMVRVETTISGNVQNQASARQHALLGLDLGLTELQKYAGLDSSVTARSDRDNSPGVIQKSITGVWRENNNTSIPDKWLVSDSNINNASTGLDPSNALGADEIYLVGDNTVGVAAGAAAQRVRVPLEKIENVPNSVIGRYAYWVGDEGVKASFGQISRFDLAQYNSATNYSLAVNRERLRQFTQVRPYVEGGFPNAFDPDLQVTQNGLRLLKNRAQLAVVGSNPAVNTPALADIQARFHDFTLLSLGVLADTNKNNYAVGKNGSLRIDLSDTVNAGVGYKDYLDARPDATAAKYLATYDVKSPVNPNAWPSFSISPLITEVGIRFKMGQPVAGSHNFTYSFSVELWNPYAATLNLPAGSKMRVRFVIPSPTNITVSDGVTPTPDQVDVGGTYDTEVDTTAAVTWKPGEVIEFSGGTKLVSTGGSATATDGTKSVAGATLVAVTEITSIAAMTPTSIVLDDGTGNNWQNFTVTGLAFNADSNSVALASAGVWHWGWGAEVKNDLLFFSFDDGGANTATMRDLRLVNQADGWYESPSASWKFVSATGNTGGPGGGTFQNGSVRILFDLPRQEVTNLGQLRHAIGTKPYELGNAWGSNAVNDIFDSRFISTVPQGAYDWVSDYRNGNIIARGLPNPYLEVYDPLAVAAATKTELQKRNEVARYLMIRGAFNVNSTSVEAWKAVLGSKLSAWDSEAAGTHDLNHAFFRVPHGAQQLTDLDATPPAPFSPISALPTTTEIDGVASLPILRAAGRQLTALEVANLASNIVSEIQTHAAANAPFKSLSAFIRNGLIGRAIAATPSESDPTKKLNEVITDQQYRGCSSALTQADIIAAIAPFMSVRSDTFVVRSYGDILNPTTGDVEGRAYCEAIVQRVPDLVSDLNAAVNDVMEPPAGSNPFGRKFKIVSFRWLSPSDI